MSRHRVPAQVQSAIQNVRAAMEEGREGWNVSIRNEKVVFTAPDATALTIGLNPNQESLKKFVREAAAYNLLDGPVRTPAEAEELLRKAEEEAHAKAEEENRRRQEFEAAQAKKKAQAEQAAKKAAAATVNGLKTQSKPETAIPTQTTASNKDSIFPPFDKSLLGTIDYSKFLLPNNTYYCIECWGEGIEFTSRKPQGLATHRGFRHQMYQGDLAHPTSTEETSRVILPGDVNDAIDLLRSVMAEHLAPAEDSGRIAELEKLLAEVKQQASADLEKADKEYQELRKNSEDSLAAAKAKIHKLTEELTGKDGKQRAEVEGLTKAFHGLLAEIHKAINELSPIKAIAKIDELVTPYLH